MSAHVGAVAVAAALCAAPCVAQQPAAERIIEVTGPVERAIEKQVEALGKGGRPEVLRLSDVLHYPFGFYQPVLTCTVLRACVIELEQGEILISLIAGDDQRWLIDHTATGPGGVTPLVMVKPTDHDVTTNLVISTDRRVYHITLDSPPRTRSLTDTNPLGSYTRHIRFYYPAEGMRRVAGRERLRREMGRDLVVDSIHFRWAWRKDKGFPWEPVAVFDDGERVYVKLPATARALEQPLLLVERGGEERSVHYTQQRGFYVVGRLFSRARFVGAATRRKGPFWKRSHVQAALYISLLAE